MMNQILVLNKREGQTPLEVIESYRQHHPEYVGIPMAYAGRLDPMAYGLIIILCGDACKERTKYLELDKEYEFEVLLGFESDTGDILGIVSLGSQLATGTDIDHYGVSQVIYSLQGRQEFPYPVFSSKTVQGKPLFLWALEKRTHEIAIPTRESVIYSLEFMGARTITKQDIISQVHQRISHVTTVTDTGKKLGMDFRRVEVLASWDASLADVPADQNYVILQFRCLCSSGTYMRTLAQYVGNRMGTKGLAWSIHRTEIGVYRAWWKSWGRWKQRYSRDRIEIDSEPAQ